LGKQLALTELKIIVVQVLKNYSLAMGTKELIMKMHNFSYQPQRLETEFTARK
jgi:cytochrome P450